MGNCLLKLKSRTRIGCWNVRTLHQTGKLAQLTKEMQRYNLSIVGVCESRWNTFGEETTATGETFLYSGNPKEEDPHTHGVGLLLSKGAVKSLIEWEPISERIITARFTSKGRNITIIQCYAPTNTTVYEEKETFYEQLQAVFQKTPKRDIRIVMGDLNAKIGKDNNDWRGTMGTEGLGQMNENGLLFASFCALNELVIGGSLFPHKQTHKATWISPDHHTENQIDHFTIDRKWRRVLLDVRVKRGADIDSDHHLLMGELRMKLAVKKKVGNKVLRRFETRKLKDNKTCQEWGIHLRNRFQALAEGDNINNKWERCKMAFTDTCKSVLGYRDPRRKDWITDATWKEIEARRDIKALLNRETDDNNKKRLRQDYQEKNRMVRKSCKRDKKAQMEELANQAETAARERNVKELYRITRQLSGKKQTTSRPIRDKQGNLLIKEFQQLERWKEHFEEVLNRFPPDTPPVIEEAGEDLNINSGRISKEEIRRAIKKLKLGRAPGKDNIPPDVLKADTNATTDILYGLLNDIWEKEEIPTDWKEGLIVTVPKKGNLSECKNWRGITLLSVPSKILCRILLDRIQEPLDKTFRREQAGFRKNNSCTDHIASLRIIVEQCIEWQSSLFINFVDFEKAFDSLDRTILWQLLRHYGIPIKLVNIIKCMYVGFTGQVIANGKLSDALHIKTGVRQGCLLSPLLFLIAIDWVMKMSVDGQRTGIQWNPFEQLEDLDFADDLALISGSHTHIQQKTTKLHEISKQLGLRINAGKTKVMRLNTKSHQPITIEEQSLEDVVEFVYLGSNISTDGGADKDVELLINKARHAFRTLRPVWLSSQLSRNTKIRIFNTNVKSVLLYGCETWKTTKSIMDKLQVFINNCLRYILRIWWPNKISNIELWRCMKQEQIDTQIKSRKWGWIGHTLRKDPRNIARQALDYNPQGKRKPGRPKSNWRRSMLGELTKTGTTWQEAKTIAQRRVRWRSMVDALCSQGGQED